MRIRRVVRFSAWSTAFVLGLVAIFLAQTWVWWQSGPRSQGTATNAMWARHQWVGEAHTEAEYQALAGTLRLNKITDVFFHAGPLAPDGSVAPRLYAHAAELVTAVHRLAPGVHAQAYLGQIRRQQGRGLLRLDDPAVRARIVETDRTFLDLGFDGVHYDIEPVYSDDGAFLDLLDRTRELTRARGRILSVSLEQLTLADALQPVFLALPRGGDPHYPARPTGAFLRAVAGRVDQVAIMTYDTELPTRSLVGRHFAWHTEHTLELIGDQVTVFMGVPTYRPVTAGWAEDLATSLRGIRRGLDALGRRPAKPYGVGIYAEWTTTPADWARYRSLWSP
ncbi:hypothetical protein ACRYCC_42400 [Actinomadura scrupuli]|uniref:hypothetical protein n=1 Tax=Actinomadura scrupuli TaxID=559629 RepID=UPI003D994C9D